MKILKNPKLENWSTFVEIPNKYSAPEMGTMYLKGNVFGHPNHEDGKCVDTSRVLSIDLKNNTAKTKSREYDLGEMHPGYKVWLDEHNKTVEDVVNNEQQK